MVGHEVEDQLQITAVQFRNQPIEIGEIPEYRIDVQVVRNVIAEISHRRGVDWRNPHRGDAEFNEIVQPRNDSRQIPDPIPIRVLK